MVILFVVSTIALFIIMFCHTLMDFAFDNIDKTPVSKRFNSEITENLNIIYNAHWVRTFVSIIYYIVTIVVITMNLR